MGWLGSLFRRSPKPPAGAREPLAFDVPQTPAAHEKLARALASLAGVERSSVRCEPRGDTLVLTLASGPRRRVVTCARHGFDLERLLGKLDSLAPDDRGRALPAVEHEDLRADHAVVYADARELGLLRGAGWTPAGGRAPAGHGGGSPTACW